MTTTELANLVFDILGVNAPGEELAGEHISKSDTEYDHVLGTLRVRRLLTWPRSDIPEQIGRDVAILIAQGLAMDYGVSPQKRQELAHNANGFQNNTSAMANIRKYARPSIARTPGEFTHY